MSILRFDDLKKQNTHKWANEEKIQHEDSPKFLHQMESGSLLAGS
jgi:hypothetical protein